MPNQHTAKSAPHRPTRFRAPQSYPLMALTLLLLVTGLCACAPRLPETSPTQTRPEFSQTQTPPTPTPPTRPAQPTERGASRLGSFNLHKRHGLGGWEGNAQTSQHQWLRQIQEAQDASKTPRPAASQPVTSGF